MAIYSGFGNRKLEQRYNQLLKQAFTILSQIIITYVSKDQFGNFQQNYIKVYQEIAKMDQKKYTYPKFSLVLTPLTQHVSFTQTIFTDSFSEKKKRPQTGNMGGSVNLNKQKNKKLSTHMAPTTRTLHSRSRYSASMDKKQIVQDINELTMEQLMQKHPIIDRKLSLFRKKFTRNRFPKILEEQIEDQIIF